RRRRGRPRPRSWSRPPTSSSTSAAGCSTPWGRAPPATSGPPARPPPRSTPSPSRPAPPAADFSCPGWYGRAPPAASPTRPAAGSHRPPGLYFGTSGVAWFLADAADALGRDDLLRRANELALAIPVRVPNSDITHGTA